MSGKTIWQQRFETIPACNITPNGLSLTFDGRAQQDSFRFALLEDIIVIRDNDQHGTTIRFRTASPAERESLRTLIESGLIDAALTANDTLALTLTFAGGRIETGSHPYLRYWRIEGPEDLEITHEGHNLSPPLAP